MPIQKITTGVIESSQTLTTPTISGNLSLDSTGTTGVRVPSANTLAFHTAGTEDMRITSAGNVAIGTTTTPTAKLWVESGRVGLTNAYKLGWHSNPAHGDLGNYITGDDSTNYIALGTGGTERMRIDSSGNLRFNSGFGSVETAYGCRAWCNLNGTGTIAIRGSGNISSVTDIGTGNYQYNLTNAMPDANYSATYNDYSYGLGWTDNLTTSSYRSQSTLTNFNAQDVLFVWTAIFR
jgi:hypothetical protein